MKIGIDARMFGPKQGGLGRYVQQLILQLEKINPPAEFVIFLRQENWGEYEPSRPNFKKVLADVPWYGLREQIDLPKILAANPVDLMHFPHWNVPLFYKKPFVVTIHDLLLLHYPTRRASTLGPLKYFFKQLMFKIVLRHATRRADQILTISNFTKADLIKTLNVPAKKISVVYPAPLPILKTATDLPTRFGITKPYVLYVGVAFPHKNLERLLEAWQLLSSKIDASHQLVLSGKNNYFYDRLRRDFAPLFAAGQVIFTDFVSDEELSLLYHHATAVVFPSLYEGFGIPPLEAMACGIPVASSNATCLPEVLQGAALYFDPLKKEEIASALETVIFDQKLRSELIGLGFDLTARYSWEKLARATFETYQNSV